MMKGRTRNRRTVLLIPMLLVASGCAQSRVPLDLTSVDPAVDQSKIAGYHSQEAVFFRLKAYEISQQVAAYEDLFGPDSEWVKGARLLVHFYEDAAAEQDRLASMHLELTGPRGASRPARLVPPR